MTYYIDYKSTKQKSWFKKLENYLFFKFSVIDIDNDKNCIYINKKYINNRAYKKLNKKLEKHNWKKLYCNTLVSKNIQIRDVEELKYIQEEKYVMKAMIYEILKYIQRIVSIDFRNESIYMALMYNKGKDILIDISNIFKSVNIVTTRLGCMRRMEHEIIKNNDILLSISNNRKKALKRAKILINLDFDNDLLNEFELNRNCIIINLNKCKLNLKNSFQGNIINEIKIAFKNQYSEYISDDNFKAEELYNSYLQNMDYRAATMAIQRDNCKILKLIGNRGIINDKEIANNFTNSIIKLDKKQKKD